MKGQNEHPLVLVFYLDRDMMKNGEILSHFAKSIDHIIQVKQFNAIALFIPTDGEERVECINPVIATEEQLTKINKLIEDITTNFSIGNVKDENEDEEKKE